MRRLIINADDFGLTRGVNRGILDSWLQGVVTSTTAMASGAAFADAIAALEQAFSGGRISPGLEPAKTRRMEIRQPENQPENRPENKDTAPRALSPSVPAFGEQLPTRETYGSANVVAALGRRKDNDAVSAASSIGVGCHVVLVDGSPVLPVEQIPTLVDTHSGKFRSRFGAFARAALSGKIDARQLEAEATAQIRRLQQSGVNVTHVDTHKHVHMFPAVLRPLLRAARACGVVAVRNPFAPARPLPYAQLQRRPFLWKRFAAVMLLRVWCAGFRRAVAAEDMLTTNGTYGIVLTGAMDEACIQGIADGMPEGTWELCCHPGYNDSELERAGTRLLASRERELELMTSGFVRDLLARQRVELITYRDL